MNKLLVSRALKIKEKIALNAHLVTRLQDGMTLFGDDNTELHLPAKAKEVYDVKGQVIPYYQRLLLLFEENTP